MGNSDRPRIFSGKAVLTSLGNKVSVLYEEFDKAVKSVKDTKKRNPFTPLDVAPTPLDAAPQTKPQENIEKPKPFVENTEKNTETTKEKVQAGEGTRFVSVSHNTEQGATEPRTAEQEPRTAEQEPRTAEQEPRTVEQAMSGQRIERQGTAQVLRDRAADESDEPNNEVAGGAAAADEAGSKSFLEAFEAL